jgi:hypothetical protein
MNWQWWYVPLILGFITLVRVLDLAQHRRTL